jgi:hypothetical protein
LGKIEDKGQILSYQCYRLVHRRIARNTDSRTAIACILPPNNFCADTAQTIKNILDSSDLFYLVAVFNSFVVDWEIRQRVTAHLDMHFVYKMRIPRLTKHDPAFAPIVTRAARLTCTTPEFDDLAKAVGLKPLTPGPSPTGGKGEQYGVTDPVERARLRAELDGLIAHLYGLTEAEFAHILGTFPLVAEPVKIAALNAYRDVARGLVK